MNGDERDRARLDVLLLDYEACREDERTSVSVQATMFSVAMALLGLISAAVTQTCQFDARGCTEVSSYVLAGAPLLPYAVIVFIYSLGVIGNIRTYYMRALEAELRAYAPGQFSTVDVALGPASLHELSQHVTSFRRGRKGYILLNLALVTGVFVFFFGLTAHIGAHVEGGARTMMLLVYPPLLVAALYESYFGFMNGRSVFASAVKAFVDQRGRSTIPRTTVAPGRERSLGSYLVLPRPEDTVKWVFIPAAYAFAAWSIGSLGDLWKLLTLWAITELLIYEARYQWNDLRDYDKDVEHEWADARRRLPHGDGSLEVRRRNAMASVAVIGVRVVGALVLAAVSRLLVEAVVIVALVFGIGLLYEQLKARNGTRPSVSRSRLDVAIWIVVGLGYGVRGGVGMLAAGLPLDSASFALGAAALAAFGTVFVLLTWALEATSFCFHTEKDGLVGPGLDQRPHIAALLSYLDVGPRLVISGVERPPNVNSCARCPVLSPKGRVAAPWNVAMVLAAMLAGALGIALADAAGAPLAYGVATALGATGATALAYAKSTVARLVVSVAVTAPLLVLAQAVGASPEPLVALPWLVFSVTYSLFRAQSYSDLKYPLRDVGKVVHKGRLRFVRLIVGPSTYDRLRLDYLVDDALEPALRRSPPSDSGDAPMSRQDADFG